MTTTLTLEALEALEASVLADAKFAAGMAYDIREGFSHPRDAFLTILGDTFAELGTFKGLSDIEANCLSGLARDAYDAECDRLGLHDPA